MLLLLLGASSLVIFFFVIRLRSATAKRGELFRVYYWGSYPAIVLRDPLPAFLLLDDTNRLLMLRHITVPYSNILSVQLTSLQSLQRNAVAALGLYSKQLSKEYPFLLIAYQQGTSKTCYAVLQAEQAVAIRRLLHRRGRRNSVFA